jgi:hypothetical protein
MKRLNSPARIAFSEIMISAKASAIEPARVIPWNAGESSSLM